MTSMSRLEELIEKQSSNQDAMLRSLKIVARCLRVLMTAMLLPGVIFGITGTLLMQRFTNGSATWWPDLLIMIFTVGSAAIILGMYSAINVVTIDEIMKYMAKNNKDKAGE